MNGLIRLRDISFFSSGNSNCASTLGGFDDDCILGSAALRSLPWLYHLHLHAFSSVVLQIHTEYHSGIKRMHFHTLRKNACIYSQRAKTHAFTASAQKRMHFHTLRQNACSLQQSATNACISKKKSVFKQEPRRQSLHFYPLPRASPPL